LFWLSDISTHIQRRRRLESVRFMSLLHVRRLFTSTTSSRSRRLVFAVRLTESARRLSFLAVFWRLFSRHRQSAPLSPLAVKATMTGHFKHRAETHTHV